MGKTDNSVNTTAVPFTHQHVLDKELVCKMLSREEKVTKSEYGQSMYRNVLNKPFVSLTVEFAINRKVLSDFGFDTSDKSVDTYRTIFKTYYNGPTDYDADVINSVHYMRENKCVFYTADKLNIGDKIPDCKLYNLDGMTTTSLYDVIAQENANHTVIAAFSMS